MFLISTNISYDYSYSHTFMHLKLIRCLFFFMHDSILLYFRFHINWHIDKLWCQVCFWLLSSILVLNFCFLLLCVENIFDLSWKYIKQMWGSREKVGDEWLWGHLSQAPGEARIFFRKGFEIFFIKGKFFFGGGGNFLTLKTPPWLCSCQRHQKIIKKQQKRMLSSNIVRKESKFL